MRDKVLKLIRTKNKLIDQEQELDELREAIDVTSAALSDQARDLEGKLYDKIIKVRGTIYTIKIKRDPESNLRVELTEWTEIKK